MSGDKTNSGNNLNKKYEIGARQSFYHKDGIWYNNLSIFPGVLFDTQGYILFHTEDEYKKCEYLSIGKELNVHGGISSIPGYKKFSELKQIKEEPKKIKLKNIHYQISLSNIDAELAIKIIKQELIKRCKAAVIAVADNHGELIGLLRLDGCPLPAITIAQNKALTAAREGKPSQEINIQLRDSHNDFDIAYYGDPRFVGWAGGMPVIIDGMVAGSI